MNIARGKCDLRAGGICPHIDDRDIHLKHTVVDEACVFNDESMMEISSGCFLAQYFNGMCSNQW